MQPKHYTFLSDQIWQLNRALVLVILSLLVAKSQAADLKAFSYLEKEFSFIKQHAEEEGFTPEREGEVRQWPILINQGLKMLSVAEQFYVVAPDGQEISATITNKEIASNGDVTFWADFDDPSSGDSGLAVLTLGEKLVFGSFINDQINLSIGIDAQGQPMLVDATSAPNRAAMLENDERFPGVEVGEQNTQISKQSFDQLMAMNAKTSGKTNVDILFVHSARFRSIFTNPQTRINQLVSFTNAAFDRSGILIEVRVVGVEEIDFDNEAEISSTLTAATNGAGDFNGLPALRNQFGADIVAVLHGNPGFSAQGVGWVNGDNPDFAFSSTRLSPGCCDSVFAHELGHNFGSGHERASVNSGAASPCNDNMTFTKFSCGHGNAANNWGTIMSRLDDVAIGYKFSNLDVDCLGEACGIAAGQSNEADNRSSFNMSRFLVANFRPEISPSNVSPSPHGLSALPPIYLLLFDD